jgi:hypothetical protein
MAKAIVPITSIAVKNVDSIYLIIFLPIREGFLIDFDGGFPAPRFLQIKRGKGGGPPCGGIFASAPASATVVDDGGRKAKPAAGEKKRGERENRERKTGEGGTEGNRRG